MVASTWLTSLIVGFESNVRGWESARLDALNRARRAVLAFMSVQLLNSMGAMAGATQPQRIIAEIAADTTRQVF